MAIQVARKLFSVTDYTKMRESGILAEDDRVELICGVVRAMTPIGPLHASIVKRLNKLFSRVLPDNVVVSVQDPIRLNDNTEPQPDLAIVRWRDDVYASGHPTAADVLLVIEVADTSADYDRNEKIPRYAEAGIAEAWLIDVASQAIEQYTLPRNNRYLNLRRLEIGDTIQSSAIEVLAVPVAQIIG